MMLFSNTLNAQKIRFKDGLVTINDKPYAKFEQTYRLNLYNDYWVKNLKGETLVFAEVKSIGKRVWDNKKQEYKISYDYYYTLNFLESGGKADDYDIIDKRGLIKKLFHNRLIKDDKIDPVSERKFILKKGGSVFNLKSPLLVEIKEDQIFHYDKLVGSFRTRSSEDDNGNEIKVIYVYNASDEKVAEAKAPVKDPLDWEVSTQTDGKVRLIKYETTDSMENLFKWISDSGYFR
jgi:hypothetical protein